MVNVGKHTIITYMDPTGIGMMIDGYWNDGRPGPFCEEECMPVLKQEHNSRVWVCLLSGLRFIDFVLVPILFYVYIYIYYMYTNTTYTLQPCCKCSICVLIHCGYSVSCQPVTKCMKHPSCVEQSKTSCFNRSCWIFWMKYVVMSRFTENTRKVSCMNM